MVLQVVYVFQMVTVAGAPYIVVYAVFVMVLVGVVVVVITLEEVTTGVLVVV